MTRIYEIIACTLIAMLLIYGMYLTISGVEI